MKELQLKYGCNPNQKKARIFMKDGEPTPMISPAFNALVKVQQILAKCETELGFTPASRARVSVRKKDDNSGNEFDGF